jgi:hypothetical protein
MFAIEFDHKVDVAAFGVEITACGRAKKIEPPDRCSPRRSEWPGSEGDAANTCETTPSSIAYIGRAEFNVTARQRTGGLTP